MGCSERYNRTESGLVDFTKLAHQFWFSTSYAPPGSGGSRSQTEEEKKEKKEQAEAVARAEFALQAAHQQRIQHRAEREQRELEREVREQTEYLQQRERDLIQQQQRECSSTSLQSM
ncbi:hypothetical protein RUM43_013020 [Polyplax serrata]|uniref:Uncharacterized protein n=1 Tax=Polyplax serrata TaxID=468196 RepID=A0AAN8NRD5_POLSC